MKNDKRLTRQDIRKANLRWVFFHHSSANYERMIGTGFAHSLSGALEKLYKDDKKGLREALKRNLTFFNTEPQLGSIIPGVSLALEETNANEEEFDPEIIHSTKNALMGPVAGIGDSILVGTLNPILLSIALGLSQDGSPLGAILYLISWVGIVGLLKYWLFNKGYELGLDAVNLLTNEEVKQKITTGLTVLGLIVIGGVASSTVSATVQLEYVSGDLTVNIQEILDNIMPNLLPLIIMLVSYWLVDKKNWSTNKLLVGILVFSAIMVALGIM